MALNFGSRADEARSVGRRRRPGEPFFCAEFWNGWFDHWGHPHHVRDASDAAATVADIVADGGSVSLYMAHGGTNFGMQAGANHFGFLQPTTTSYDYDAPIAENGALTEKFRAFRDVIAQHAELPPYEEHLEQLGLAAQPTTLPAGEVAIEKIASLRATERFTRAAAEHPTPPAFEDIGLERGLLRLSREIEIAAEVVEGEARIQPLRLYDLHDRAWVYVDGINVGATGVVGNEENEIDPAVIELTPFADRLLPGGGRRTVRVDILVENLGRVNFGPKLGERKGILGGVWQTIRFLNGWEADAWPLEDMGEELAALLETAPALEEEGGADDLPVLVSASFEAESSQDAFLDLSDAGHGVAYVNGFCVGRYWNIGPQQSLYVPAPLVREGRNEVLLLDLDKRPTQLSLVTEHVFDTPGA